MKVTEVPQKTNLSHEVIWKEIDNIKLFEQWQLNPSLVMDGRNEVQQPHRDIEFVDDFTGLN